MTSTKTVHPLAKSANWLDWITGIVKLYLYRFLAGLVVAAALLLTMATPQDLLRLQMPEPWSYQLAAENFVQGKWTLTTEEVAAARTQVRIQGSRLTQYIEIAPDVWAFRRSLGLPLQLAFFQTIAGQPRLANISLALVAALIVYTLLSLWFNEKAALIGVTFLFSHCQRLCHQHSHPIGLHHRDPFCILLQSPPVPLTVQGVETRPSNGRRCGG
jgi:hypothetical protein